MIIIISLLPESDGCAGDNLNSGLMSVNLIYFDSTDNAPHHQFFALEENKNTAQLVSSSDFLLQNNYNRNLPCCIDSIPNSFNTSIIIIMSLLDPPSDILQLLHESWEVPAPSLEEDEDEILSYVAFLAAGLTEANEFDPAVWKDALTPYMEESYPDASQHAAMVETFRQATQKSLSPMDDEESVGEHDDDEEAVCDLRFNLAYGGKILLHNTKLRLLRGKRYALVGQNGVGKTTVRIGQDEADPSQQIHLISLSFSFVALC